MDVGLAEADGLSQLHTRKVWASHVQTLVSFTFPDLG